MKTNSLRFRLTCWYAGILTLVVICLAIVLSFHLSTYLENTLQVAQLQRAEQIANTLVVDIGSSGERNVAAQIETLYAPEKSDRFIRITQDTGRTIYVSGMPNDQIFDPAKIPNAADARGTTSSRKQEVPGASPLLISGVRVKADSGAGYLVEVGVSSAPVDALFVHMLWLLGLAFPLVILLAALGAYVLVRNALKPVDRIARKAELITQHNLSERLPLAKTGDEIERLSVSLNHMIDRLDDAFQNSKRFVADASHELRTPLTILRGEMEELVQDHSVGPAHRERIGSLLEEVERLSKIVERLFALSRLDAGEAQTEWVEFDLAELSAITANQMELLAEDRNIVLTTSTEGRVAIQGDRARLKQVVVNLVDNAVKYTPEGGAVNLSVLAVGKEAVLEVSDTGIGIEPESVPHVFDRFYRADKTRSRNPDGAGLGLAIVKAICNAHHGELDVVSVLGKGSKFRVRFPLVSSTGG